MAQGVNPAVKGVESAAPHALIDARIAEARRSKLGARDHAVLAAGDRRDPRVNPGWTTFLAQRERFVVHPLIVAEIALRVSP
jgi:hypothetical protein